MRNKVIRPFQEFKNGSIKWFTDDNSIYFKGEFLTEFIQSYAVVVDNPFDVRMKIIQDFGNYSSEETGDAVVKNIINLNLKDLFEYFLVYCDLPESVEAFLISKYKYFKGEKAKLQDRINEKRRRVNG